MKHVLIAIGKVLKIPKYGLVAFVSAFAVLGILIWIFHLPELWYVIALDNFPASEKTAFLFSGYRNTLLYVHEPLIFTRVVFSLLAGINIALYWFIRKREQTAKARRGLGGFVAAVVGSGCITCGTSLLSPVLGSSVGFASASYTSSLGLLGNIIGIVLMLYSLQGFGKRAAYELARSNIIDKKEDGV